MKNIKVSILVGSDSDLPVLSSTVKVLKEFEVPYNINVASAHRTPNYLKQCINDSVKQGAKVFIAGAGMAAALPGVVASETHLPVIGIPISGKTLNGMDSLLSIVQMPPGIPVATVAVGKAGATNAAILALEIISLTDTVLREKLIRYRKKLASTVILKDKKLKKLGIEKYISEAEK